MCFDSSSASISIFDNSLSHEASASFLVLLKFQCGISFSRLFFADSTLTAEIPTFTKICSPSSVSNSKDALRDLSFNLFKSTGVSFLAIVALLNSLEN